MSALNDYNPITNEVINNPNNNEELTISPTYLFYFKVLYLIIIGTISLLFGLLPLCIRKYRRGNKILNYANAFSGGIFLGIGLFHLLPEASEHFQKYYATPEGGKSFFFGYPMSYFIAFLSYSLILYLEKIAFNSHALTAHTHSLHENEEKEICNNLGEPLLNENDKIFHDCTEDLYNYENMEKEKYINLEESNKEDQSNDEIDNEEIIRNIVSSKGQFSSLLHARNMSKFLF